MFLSYVVDCLFFSFLGVIGGLFPPIVGDDTRVVAITKKKEVHKGVKPLMV